MLYGTPSIWNASQEGWGFTRRLAVGQDTIRFLHLKQKMHSAGNMEV